MSDYFNEDSDKEYTPFKDDVEDANDENEMARLASLHVNEVLDENGVIIEEDDRSVSEGDPEDTSI